MQAKDKILKRAPTQISLIWSCDHAKSHSKYMIHLHVLSKSMNIFIIRHFLVRKAWPWPSLSVIAGKYSCQKKSKQTTQCISNSQTGIRIIFLNISFKMADTIKIIPSDSMNLHYTTIKICLDLILLIRTDYFWKKIHSLVSVM